MRDPSDARFDAKASIAIHQSAETRQINRVESGPENTGHKSAGRIPWRRNEGPRSKIHRFRDKVRARVSQVHRKAPERTDEPAGGADLLMKSAKDFPRAPNAMPKAINQLPRDSRVGLPLARALSRRGPDLFFPAL